LILMEKKNYAGFWRRCLAGLFDAAFFSFIVFLYYFIFFGASGPGVSQSNGILNLPFASIASEQFFILSVTLFFWVKFLGTPGKLFFGCYVVDRETGEPINLLQGFIRYLSYLVSAIPLGLGFFWIAWDKKKQGFHDKIAGTLVVRETPHVISDDESQKTVQQLMSELR